MRYKDHIEAMKKTIVSNLDTMVPGDYPHQSEQAIQFFYFYIFLSLKSRSLVSVSPVSSLPVPQSPCPPVSRFFYLPVSQSPGFSVNWPNCLPVPQFPCPLVSLSPCFYISLSPVSLSPCLPVSVSLCLTVSLPLCLTVSLSLSLSVSQSVFLSLLSADCSISNLGYPLVFLFFFIFCARVSTQRLIIPYSEPAAPQDRRAQRPSSNPGPYPPTGTIWPPHLHLFG